jgi:acyl-CoA dehydrogenase
MASGEIRLEGASAWLIGERGQGFKLMTDMINNSRLSNGVRAAGLMRRALTEALYIAQHRMAFGKRLIDMPLMQKQLLKMTVWTEQARTMVFQTAKVLEAADRNDANAKKLARIMTPLIKFRACRDARKVTGDAMEVRGGCGYIEEWADARLLRDAHLGSIWEGTSNIVALDVLRAIGREGCLPVLKAYVDDLLAADSLKRGSAAINPLTAIQHLTIERAFSLAANAVDKPQLARQVASALYHVVTIAGMRWEAQQPPSTEQKSLSHRAVLADLIFQHRLRARDPLDDDADVSSDDALLLLRQST